MSTIADKMFDSFLYGKSLQSGVREFISDSRSFSPKEVADAIAVDVSVFKTKSFAHANDTCTSIAERNMLHKKANNIINDVSRICRDTIGYSIVNSKRKGGEFTYVSKQFIEGIEKERVTTKTRVSSTIVETLSPESIIAFYSEEQIVSALSAQTGKTYIGYIGAQNLVDQYVGITGELKPLVEAVVDTYKKVTYKKVEGE